MADKIYKVELSVENISKLINKYNNISKALSSIEFKQFLLEKCKKKRDEILSGKDIPSGSYIAGNHEEIDGDTITLYNDSYLDVTQLTHFFNENNRNTHYANGISLAELVEYGTGLVGSNSSLNTGEEWEYMINEDRDYNKGWIYKGSDGQPKFTRGTEGKYIYFYLAKAIEDNIEDWIEEFLDKKLGSGL